MRTRVGWRRDVAAARRPGAHGSIPRGTVAQGPRRGAVRPRGAAVAAGRLHLDGAAARAAAAVLLLARAPGADAPGHAGLPDLSHHGRAAARSARGAGRHAALAAAGAGAV